jgi:hypothetical protein
MPDDLIELIAPYGTDEANHGTERYRVDNNGRIRVPREAAFHLIRAGFKPLSSSAPEARVPEPPPDPAPAAAPHPEEPRSGVAKEPAPSGPFLMPEPAPEPAAPLRRVPRSTK